MNIFALFWSAGWHNVDKSTRALGHLLPNLHYSNRFFCTLLERWLAQVDSNHRPRAYQARALTS